MIESLVSATYMIGWSFGFVLDRVGGDGRSIGRLPVACVIAVWTSVAAASMFLSRENWRVRLTWPWVLFDVTISRPVICMNWRSSGVAMLLAIVSGLAPG